MVFGLGPMGCIPLQRVLSTSGDCQDRSNKLALSFNKAGSKLMQDLTTKLPNSSYKFGDAYDVVNNVITNPSQYGIYVLFNYNILEYWCTPFSLFLIFFSFSFWGSNSTFVGFSNSDSPCCSFGKIRPALTCVPASVLCKDRSKYVFWDEYHPSDSANQIIANELIKKFGFTRVNQGNAPSSAPAIAPSPDQD